MFVVGGLAVGGIVTWLIVSSSIREAKERLEEEKQKRITAETRLEEKTRAWEEAGKALKDSFDATASRALKDNNRAFLELAGKTLENYITQSKGDLGKRQEAIEQMLKPFKERLEEHEKMTHELEKSTKQTFGWVQNYMNQLRDSQEKLSRETGALVSALKSPRVRGRWGEIGLKRIVEFSGMSAYCDFTEQQSVSTGEGRLRPDMIVNLPGNRKVIVDSKVPLNAYLESLEEEDESGKPVLVKKHAADVRGHMNKLGSKHYWSQFDNTVDFVVLYMEIESAFGAALIQDRELILDGIRSKVIFATPTTLITLLRTIAFSWKQQDVAENANKISDAGRDLFDRLCTFAEHLAGVGKGIGSALNSYNKAVGSWESRVMPGTRKLKDLGVSTEKKTLPEMNELDHKPRDLREDND